MIGNRWLFRLKEQKDAKMRLFCFPYSGSGASIFFNWAKSISNEIEMCAIKYPGRESRFNENPCTRMANLIEDLTPEILPFLDKPFMFFGHSLGAHISFYLARHLRRNDLPCPFHMFISGARAPHIPCNDTDGLYYSMDDKKFIEKLIEMGGMAEEILQNRELFDLILPSSRLLM